MNQILALDPGVTTGLSVYTTEKTFVSFQFASDKFDAPHGAFIDLLTTIGPQVILYEAFHFRQDKTGTNLTGVEFIGIAKAYAQKIDVPLYSITPSQGKAFWDNNKLKALGLYKPATPHGMDATRILLTFMMKEYPDFRREALLKLKIALGE